MKKEEKIYLNAINHVKTLGPYRQRLLKKYFGDYQAAWHNQSESSFLQAGLPPKCVKNLRLAQKTKDPQKLWAKLEKEKIEIYSPPDQDYPSLLEQIHNPPEIIYARGQIETLAKPTIGIVGTRKNTAYGEISTLKIAQELAEQNICVVSGLALGIDAIAHQAALNSNQIYVTAAVLGSSLTSKEIYPRTNLKLAEKIIENGVLVSEYPPDSPVYKENFPTRNRIISGLSLGTLVIEAGKKSGALITAFLALEQNREVMAIPGNINASQSAGPNMLITKGAALVRNGDDILNCLNLEKEDKNQQSKIISLETAQEKEIYKNLSSQPITLDRLASLTKFDVNVISSTLSMMELKSLAKKISGLGYIKT